MSYELRNSFKAANLPYQFGVDADNFVSVRRFPLHRGFDASHEGALC